MITVAAIMPCLGRPEQTVRNVERLLATAGYSDCALICVCDGDEEVYEALKAEVGERCNPVLFTRFGTLSQEPQGYWHAMSYVQPQEGLICNLANDLWACDGWLATAIEEYQHHFGDGDGLLGFAGDGHGPQHSCHFLISRALLDRYGGWPIWYAHNFGDAELCARAQQDGLYQKSTAAYLEHCHVERGLAEDDAVYQAGRARYREDEALFVKRRRLRWPPVSQ